MYIKSCYTSSPSLTQAVSLSLSPRSLLLSLAVSSHWITLNEYTDKTNRHTHHILFILILTLWLSSTLIQQYFTLLLSAKNKEPFLNRHFKNQNDCEQYFLQLHSPLTLSVSPLAITSFFSICQKWRWRLL